MNKFTNCPHCGLPMTKNLYRGVEVDGCVRCRTMRFDMLKPENTGESVSDDSPASDKIAL